MQHNLKHSADYSVNMQTKRVIPQLFH